LNPTINYLSLLSHFVFSFSNLRPSKHNVTFRNKTLTIGLCIW
jgi:hypothetical protein